MCEYHIWKLHFITFATIFQRIPYFQFYLFMFRHITCAQYNSKNVTRARMSLYITFFQFYFVVLVSGLSVCIRTHPYVCVYASVCCCSVPSMSEVKMLARACALATKLLLLYFILLKQKRGVYIP